MRYRGWGIGISDGWEIRKDWYQIRHHGCLCNIGEAIIVFGDV